MLALKAVDGHWWKGNIDGTSASIIAIALVLPCLVIPVALFRLYRRGKAMAKAINDRHIVSDLKEERAPIDELDVPIWRLVVSIAFLSGFVVVLLGGLNRLLHGLPLHSDASRPRWRRRAHLYKLLEPYIPDGPIYVSLIILLACLALLFLVWLLWRRIVVLIRRMRSPKQEEPVS